jgi:hypothetical protein
VVLPFIRATYPDRPDTFVIAGVLPFLIVFLDAATALEWSGITPRRPLGIIAPWVILVFCVFTILGAWTVIPKGIMHIYKFGFLHDASLILDDEGCAIIRGHGVQKKLEELKPQEDKRCRVSGVTIHSRLGSTYYVEVEGDDSSTRFIIPAERVLSWAIIEPKKPGTAKAPENMQNPTSTRETTPPNDGNRVEKN